MAKVSFKRRLTNEDVEEIPIEDGNFIVTKEGSIFVDYDGERKEIKSGGGNTIPIGSEFDYDGTTVPEGYEEVDDPKGKILWSNPNPTNNFDAQTIAIDFSNYDMYEVVFYQSTKHNERELTSGRIRTQKGSVLSYVPNNNFRAWNCTNSNISFESISDNSNLIPAYIIGYKTGLFN